VKNNLIPFPTPSDARDPQNRGSRSRFVVRLGNQRIAFDLSCQATLLNRKTEPIPISANQGEPAEGCKQ
jgi:hypothetical protein